MKNSIYLYKFFRTIERIAKISHYVRNSTLFIIDIEGVTRSRWGKRNKERSKEGGRGGTASEMKRGPCSMHPAQPGSPTVTINNTSLPSRDVSHLYVPRPRVLRPFIASLSLSLNPPFSLSIHTVNISVHV